MHFALTGATGFLGGHILQKLGKTNNQISALSRADTSPAPIQTRWIRGRLEDPQSLRNLVRGTDVVIHCAGTIKEKSRRAFFKTNQEGTANLLDACKHEDVQRFIFISSIAARSPDISSYAASKASAEELVRASDLNWTILRPGVIYGPGDRETLIFFKLARLGLGLQIGHGRYAMIMAEDVANAALTVSECFETCHKILTLHDGSRDGYSMGDLFKALEKVLNHRNYILPLPPGLAIGLSSFVNRSLQRFGKRVPLVTPEKIAEILHPDWTSSDDALNRLTGWSPEYSLHRGLELTAAWYRSHHWL